MPEQFDDVDASCVELMVPTKLLTLGVIKDCHEELEGAEIELAAVASRMVVVVELRVRWMVVVLVTPVIVLVASGRVDKEELETPHPSFRLTVMVVVKVCVLLVVSVPEELSA